MKVKEEREKVCLKLNIQKLRSCHLVPSLQFSSVAQLCPTLCDPMNCSIPGFPVHHQLLEFTQTHVHWVVMPYNHLILCCPLFFLLAIFSSFRVFSSESALRIRWLKDWSFSFSISASNECSGLISFRIDWFDQHDYTSIYIYIYIYIYICNWHTLPLAFNLSQHQGLFQ